MRVFIKICGLSTPRAVDAAVSAGADAIGFVFAESPRRVTPRRALELCSDVPPVVLRVAVMRHPSPDEWQRVVDEFEPDWLQTDAADFPSLQLPESVTPLPVFRDVPGLALSALQREPLMLFEAAESGHGVRADWRRAAELTGALGEQHPLILAGGLDPHNVGEAIARVRPFGVDVSSGVEMRRGVKDPARIAAFVAAVREAEQAAHAD